MRHAVNMAVFAASIMNVDRVVVVASQTDVEALRDGILAASSQDGTSWQEILNATLSDTNHIVCDDGGYFLKAGSSTDCQGGGEFGLGLGHGLDRGETTS